MKLLRYILFSFFLASTVIASDVILENGAIGQDDILNTSAFMKKDAKKMLLQEMETCDQYLAYWNYQKKHIYLYLIGKGTLRIWGEDKSDALYQIEQKIVLIEDVKKRYAALLGLYKKGHRVGADLDVENDLLYRVKPPSDFDRNFLQYSLVAIGAVIGACLVYKHRDFLNKSVHTLYKNNIKRPWNSLKNYLLDKKESGIDVDKDIIGQRKALKYKIQDIARELRPDLNDEALERISEHARKQGFEDFLADFINNYAQWGKKSKDVTIERKESWFGWIFSLKKLFGMSPKAKILELEVKGLITRLKATQLLVEANDIVNKNKLNLILLTMSPNAIVSFLIYAACQKVRSMYKNANLAKNKRKINNLLLQINEIITKNIGSNSLSDENQGFLCYYNHQLLQVLPEYIRVYFETMLSEFESSSNTVDQKLKIFQSINFALHTS